MKVLREVTQERGGPEKSLILKDAHNIVILLFCGSIWTNTQWSPKETDKSPFITSHKRDRFISIPNSKDFQLEPNAN